jgi:uncharacterized protein (TIGR00369 family)
VTAPIDRAIEARVRDSFSRQPAMGLIGARMERVEPGFAEITLSTRPDLLQQHGFIHGGIIGMICDNACGYAALTLLPVDCGVLSIEYKVSFLAPARGREIVARGHVLRAGHTVTFSRGEGFARDEGNETLVATMTATLRTVRGREDVRD